MKIQSSIKHIGLICIVLGISGMAWYISDLVPPSIDMPDKNFADPPSYLLCWNLRLTYIGILVNAFYFTAGILFLMKKYFSIKVMYSALAIMILYKLIPLIILNPTGNLPFNLRYEFNFENLVSPVFNLVLLLVVYIFSSKYIIPLDEDTGSSRIEPKHIGFLISGYVLLILSSAYLGWEIIGLLVFPVYLLSIGLILVFYLSLIRKEDRNRWLAITLIISGTILLSAAVGYSGANLLEYLSYGPIDKNSGILPTLWPAIGVYILASLIILFGIKQSTIINKKKQYHLWLPSIFILPLAMLLIVIIDVM